LSLNLKVIVFNWLLSKGTCQCISGQACYSLSVIYIAVCDVIGVVAILTLVFKASKIVCCHAERLLFYI